MTLLAAFSADPRYTGQDDLVVGTPSPTAAGSRWSP